MAGNQPNISRDTFNVGKEYLRLRIQSGAGVGDFDLNEMQDLLHFRARQLVYNLFGSGRLKTADARDGFLIEEAVSTTTNNFQVQPGIVLVSGHVVDLLATREYEDVANALFSGTVEEFDSAPSVKIRDSLKRWITEHDLVGCRFEISGGGTVDITSVTGLSELQLASLPGGMAVGATYLIHPPVLTNPGGARSDEVYVQMFYEDIAGEEDSDRIDPITGQETAHATKLRYVLRVAEGGTTPADVEGTFGSIGVGVWYQKIADLARTGASIVAGEMTPTDAALATELLDNEYDAALTAENFPVQGTPKTYASLDARLEELGDFFRADIAQLKGVADTGANWDGDVSSLVTMTRLGQRYRLNGTTIEMGVGLYYDPVGAGGAAWYREDAAGGGIVVESRLGSFRIQHATTFGGNDEATAFTEYQFDVDATRQITLPGKLRLGAGSTSPDLEVWNGAAAFVSVLSQLADIIGGGSPNWFDTVPNIPGGVDSLFNLNTRVNAIETSFVYSVSVADPIIDLGSVGNPLIALAIDSSLQVSGGLLGVVSGGGSGLDADTLDMLDSLQFLRSDVADDVDGVLTFKARPQLGKDIRLWGHNQAETVFYTLIGLDASDQVVVGTTSQPAVINSSVSVSIPAGVNAGANNIETTGAIFTDVYDLDTVGADAATALAHANTVTGNPHNLDSVDVGAAPASKGVTNGDSHDHDGGDGATILEDGVGGAVARWAGGARIDVSTGVSLSTSPIGRDGNIVLSSPGANDFHVTYFQTGETRILVPSGFTVEDYQITVSMALFNFIFAIFLVSSTQWKITTLSLTPSPADADYNVQINRVT